jgi:hypothetical protein
MDINTQGRFVVTGKNGHKNLRSKLS